MDKKRAAKLLRSAGLQLRPGSLPPSGYIGSITCRGKSCPIWLNTMGLKMLQIGQPEGAIRAFNDALALAPDFIDVQNNIGTAYGMNDQHEKAYAAFKKAFEMKPGYLKALNGLIVSEKHLGMYEEALQHCDQMERLGGNADQLRQSIREAMNGDDPKQPINYLDVTIALLDSGRKAGYIQSKDFAHIPEIMVRAEEVCTKIIVGINEYAEENPGEVSNPSSVMLVWAAYAGMGAVYHWHIAWNELSSKGIYETLTQERGLFAMDEYVIDAIGVGFGSDEERTLTKFMWEQVGQCMIMMADGETSMESFMACAKAMYLFGMTFEMNRLGML